MDKKLDPLKPDDLVNAIPKDKLITIQVSGLFYQRIQNNLFDIISQADDLAKVPVILEELKTREPVNIWETSVSILMALAYEIETKAKEQKAFTKTTVSTFLDNDANEDS